MKHKALIVLKALLQGLTIPHDLYDLCLSEDNELCYLMNVEHWEKGVKVLPDERKLFLADMNITAFINWAEKMDDSIITILAANMALNKYKMDNQ